MTTSENDRVRARSETIGEAKRAFDLIRVDHPPHTAAVSRINEIRIAARRDGEMKGGGYLIAPPGTGKTEVFRRAERELVPNPAAGARPVLRVTLDSRGTTDSVPQSILATLGARRPGSGRERDQWARAVEEMRTANVEILLLDEFNRAGRRPTMSGPILVAIQDWILDPGVCPIVLAGSERAEAVLKAAPHVHERLEDEIALPAMRWGSTRDQRRMERFLGQVDEAIRNADILPATSGLAEDDLPRLLCRATGGKVRAIMKTLRIAVGCAVGRGADSMSRRDLGTGVERYCRRIGLTTSNPLLGGEAEE